MNQRDRDRVTAWVKANPERRKEHIRRSNRKRRAIKMAWARSNHRYRSEEIAGRPRAPICEVCLDPTKNLHRGKATVFEHDHRTGEFRGWTCAQCNIAIGMVRDNPETLRRLADYLDRNGFGPGPAREEVDRVIAAYEEAAEAF